MARWENPVLEEIDACLHLAGDDEELLADISGRLFGASPSTSAPGCGCARYGPDSWAVACLPGGCPARACLGARR